VTLLYLPDRGTGSPVAACRRRIELRIAAMRDPVAHARIAAEELGWVAPEIAVAVLHSFHIDQSGPDARLAYLGIARLLLGADELDYDAVQQIYRLARERELVSVRFSLLPLPPHKLAVLSKDRVEYAEGRLTLGERKSLARRPDRNLLCRMVADTEPDVVAILLDNPRMTEREAVTIAARRPTTIGALTHVAQHPRWMAMPEVQLALCSNPYAPAHFAALLGPMLRTALLRGLSTDPRLHPVAREACTYLAHIREARLAKEDTP
jgi:hypothetical protein